MTSQLQRTCGGRRRDVINTLHHQLRDSPCCLIIQSYFSFFLSFSWTFNLISLLPLISSSFLSLSNFIRHRLNANLWFLNFSVGGPGRMHNVDAHPELTVTSFTQGFSPLPRTLTHWRNHKPLFQLFPLSPVADNDGLVWRYLLFLSIGGMLTPRFQSTR